MRVIRTMPDEGWVPVSNAAARDHRLSWRARGLLAELLSYPDGWETTVDKLVAQARRSGDATEGRAAMRKAMKELADAGYVTYERTKDENRHWNTEMIVSDNPDPEAASRRTKDRTVEIPAPRDPGPSETRTSGDWDVLNNKVTNTVTKTDVQRRSDEHSASLTSFADGADAPPTISTETSTLDDVYRMVNLMDPGIRRNGLLDLERRRAKIYRECRRNAIAQIKKDHPTDFNKPHRAEAINRLSYQYAVLHYYPDLPPWLARPISEGVAAASGR